MPVTGGTLQVEGLRELQRHFYVIDKDLSKDLKDGLKRAAEPVKGTTERLTIQRIKVSRVPWWQFKIGANQREVYIVPKRKQSKNARHRRKGFAVMVSPLMVRALESNEARVHREAEVVLNRSISKWGRG